MYQVVAWLEWPLALAAAAVVLWICMPDALYTLGFSNFRNWVGGGPSDIMPDGSDERYADLHGQLLQLGFVPLGRYWEQMLGNAIEEQAFALPQESCMAAVNRIVGGEAHVIFVTVFTDGAAVRTSNYCLELTSSPEWLVQSVPGHDLAAPLETHRDGVRGFLSSGRVPRDITTLEEFAAAQLAYFKNPGVQRMMRTSYRSLLGFKALFLGTAPAVVALICWTQRTSMLPALVVVLVMAVSYLRHERRTLQINSRKINEEQDDPGCDQ